MTTAAHRQPFAHTTKIHGNPTQLRHQRNPWPPEKKEQLRRILVWTLVILLTLSILGSVNDITALNRSSDPQVVTIASGSNTSEVLTALHHAGLIDHPRFCGWFLTLTHEAQKTDTHYLPGTYSLSRDMGVETMIHTISQGTEQPTSKRSTKPYA